MIQPMNHFIHMERIVVQMVERYQGQTTLTLRVTMGLDRMVAKHLDMGLGNVINLTTTTIRLD